MEKDERAACKSVACQLDQTPLQGDAIPSSPGLHRAPPWLKHVGATMIALLTRYRTVADVGQRQLEDAGKGGSVRVCQKAHQHHRPQHQEFRAREFCIDPALLLSFVPFFQVAASSGARASACISMLTRCLLGVAGRLWSRPCQWY